MSDPWLEIDCGPRVVALQTTCDPDPAPYGSFNLGLHVGDDVGAVVKNRAHLASYFGEEVYFPEQIHGINVVRVDRDSPVIAADAVVTPTKPTLLVCWYLSEVLVLGIPKGKRIR